MPSNHTTNTTKTDRKSYSSLREAFFAHLTPGEQDECWIWPSCKTKNGYGLFTFKNKKYYAHRVSYEIYYGPFDKRMDVLHKCDIPACCNPSHLWTGTAKENADDMISKGRGRHKSFPGELHHAAKLTEEQVKEIRKLADLGVNQTKIGIIFGVSQTTVTQIKCRRVWAHIE